MQLSTLISVGMFMVAATAVGINIWKARKEKHQDKIDETAAVMKARAEMSLGSIEAAERVITMYGKALSDLQSRVQYLEGRVQELEQENFLLRSRGNGVDYSHGG